MHILKSVPSVIFLICVVNCFSSCSSSSSSALNQDGTGQVVNTHSLAGKLYFFAPEFDSTNLVATGACDCCSANVAFLNDSSFLYIDYCDEGCSYIRGKYQMDDHLLTLDFDSVIVESVYPEEADSTTGRSAKTTYHLTIHKPDSRTYLKQEYKSMTLFVHNEVGALDKNRNFGNLMQTIRSEGIWDRLNTNPKSIARNSTDIELYLQGDWAMPGDVNASFEIQNDSIYYIEEVKKFPFKINNDSMKISIGNSEMVYPVKMMGADTLIFEGRERQVFYRLNYSALKK